MKSNIGFRSLAPLVLVAVIAGCAAAAAGAGALGVIAYNERGAEVNLNASVEAATAATEAVFAELGISTTSRATENGGAEVERQYAEDVLKRIMDRL